MPATFTVKQVADILGYSTNSIYSFLKAKRIKGVRVGKGRFRIPQGELDRLLLVKKGESEYISTHVTPVSYVATTQGHSETTENGSQSNASDTLKSSIETIGAVEVPSLFDWFVGVGSIILGLAMFLFSKSYDEFTASSVVLWIPMIRTILISGGIGLLLSDMVGRKSRIWTMVFRLVLFVVYAVYAGISIARGDYDAGVIFGLIIPLIALSFGSFSKGLKIFVLYILALSAYSVFSFGGASIIRAFVGSFGFIGYGSAVILSGLVVFMVYQAMDRSRRLLNGIVVLSCVGLVASSVSSASHMMWGRSLFVLMAGLFALFVPIWGALTFSHKRDRSFVFGVISSLLLLFVSVIGSIGIMQKNMITVASRELDNKVVYGKVSVETALESAKSSLVSLSTNPLLVESMKTKKTETLLDMSKTIVGTNSVMKQIRTISAEGDVLTVYPHTQMVATNLKEVEYFTHAMSSKQTVVSDVFESISSEVKRKVVVIASPVINQKSELLGVIVGQLDIDTLAMNIQKLTSESMGEYAMIVDKSGRYVVHPDATQIGVEASNDNPIRIGLTGKRGVNTEYTEEGNHWIVAVDEINNSTGWAISMNTPVSSALRMSETSVTVISFLLIVSGCIMAIFFSSHRKKDIPPNIHGALSARSEDTS